MPCLARSLHSYPAQASPSRSRRCPASVATVTIKGCSDREGSCERARALVSNKQSTRNLYTQWVNGKGLAFSELRFVDDFVVAVDVDEVLGNFVSALNRFVADQYSSHHSVSEYHVYEFFRIWNCSREEANFRVHEFFETSYFKTGIQPIPGAQKALHNLSKICKLSRQHVIKDHTLEWLEEHYPGLFDEIHFGNHFALNGVSKPKSEICRSLGAKVLIDDNPKYAIECAEAGIRVLLFDYENSYPWSKMDSVESHPLVTRVYDWADVEKELVNLVFPN